MPSTLTYPGVYVEEIPSGVRTLTGVATSITAFLGRTKRGPVNQPTLITSFKDFERSFGGLVVDCPLTYAVADFFRNGGTQAVICRLYHPQTVSGASASGIATFAVGTLSLQAASPGTWGNNLLCAVDYQDCTGDIGQEVADSLNVTTSDLFNLTVTYYTSSSTVTERFTNLTVKDTVRRVDRVLSQSSKFVRVPVDATGAPTLPASIPAVSVLNDNKELGTRATSGTALDSAALLTTDYNFSLLDSVDLFNLMCLPPDTRGGDTSKDVYGPALTYCASRRAILIVDPPAAWSSKDASDITLSDLQLTGTAARNGVIYHPRVLQSDPLRNGLQDTFVPCGIIAGIISATSAQRGVWKAPAGLDATITGINGLAQKLTDTDSGILNPKGINCLRTFAASGSVIWGARTLRGADALGDEYKYLSVRRLALFMEESIYRGTQWAVFEPNDAPLWTQLRMDVGSFMQRLFRQGAFQGQTANEAYFVKCDSETTTADDISNGIVNILVGFSPLKPAEFVVLQFQQMAGQTSS